ncbi:MAG: hypothetical protein QGF00_10700 [Planctomycetota bacterium]|jgi:hypothetical protein|nr:hypothetical protein [Planctomycetota bacterium]MDP7250058.1 hypothetical protein [Planctomycetota bacterium]
MSRSLSLRFRAIVAACLLVGMAVTLVCCGSKKAVVSVTSSATEGCEAAGCHGAIENIHPLFQLTCSECHGGDPDGATELAAHVARPADFGDFPLEANSHVNNDQFLRGPRLVREDDANNTDHSDADILAYRRFINPGDLLVADRSCGSGFPRETGKCHGEIVDFVSRSTHATSAGLVSGVYYINGFRDRFAQVSGDDTDKDAFVCAVLPNGQPIVDPDFDASIPGTVERIDNEVPRDIFSNRNPNAPDNAAIDGDFMFRMMTSFVHNDCARCHIYTEGVKRFGEFRSSGCSACHVYYSNEGRSETADVTISKEETDHPFRHEMQRYPPDEQCIHCHNRGGRHGSEYNGIRERPQGFRDTIFNDHAENNRSNDADLAGGRTGGFFPTLPRFFLSRTAANSLDPAAALGDFIFGREYVESKLWGRDTGRTDGNNYLIRDEDRSNSVDETPSDVHADRGMQCVDCHTREELHGDGHIYSDRFFEHEIECESCHGTPTEKADLLTRKGRRIHGTGPGTGSRRIYQDAAGDIFQVFAPKQGRLDPDDEQAEVTRRVVQVADVLDPNHADFKAGAADGCGLHSAGGNRLECFTCHATWANNCLSCHMILDYGNAASGDTNQDGVIESPKNFATSYLDNTSRLGLQDQERFLTVPDHLVLGINYEGKISPFQIGGQAVLYAVSATGARGANNDGDYDFANFVTDPALGAAGNPKNFSNFVFTVNDNNRFLISMPMNQNFPHTVQEKPRNCDACHPNPNLTGNDRTTQLGLVDKAIGIGNGLRRALGVENSVNRISTARVYDDPDNGTGTVTVQPFTTGSLANLTYRFRDIRIRREDVRIFTRGVDKGAGATDHFIEQTAANATNGDIFDINLDEFIRLQPNPTTMTNNQLAGFAVVSITRQRPTTHASSGPLDTAAIQKILRNLVPPQARDSDD